MTTPEPAWSSPVAGSVAGRAVSNPFDSDPVARRYAHARRYYHRSALDMATSQLGISHVSLAVDVACGTGLPTRAVLELADCVIAIDASHAMLRAAQPKSRDRYLVAAAERIPLHDAAADLATVAAAFHWFDQPRAFTELARVLRPGAGLPSTPTSSTASSPASPHSPPGSKRPICPATRPRRATPTLTPPPR